MKVPEMKFANLGTAAEKVAQAVKGLDTKDARRVLSMVQDSLYDMDSKNGLGCSPITTTADEIAEALKKARTAKKTKAKK